MANVEDVFVNLKLSSSEKNIYEKTQQKKEQNYTFFAFSLLYHSMNRPSVIFGYFN